MDSGSIVILAIVIIGLVLFIKKLQPISSGAGNDSQKTELVYSKKQFISMAERTFLGKLQTLEQLGYKIVPQVSLVSVIAKQSEAKHRTELFRVIDFGVFTKEYELLALVELNDSSHETPARIRRDKRVRSIVATAGIPLITFYTSKPNEQEYVVQRILQQINQQPSDSI